MSDELELSREDDPESTLVAPGPLCSSQGHGFNEGSVGSGERVVCCLQCTAVWHTFYRHALQLTSLSGAEGRAIAATSASNTVQFWRDAGGSLDDVAAKDESDGSGSDPPG